MPQFHGRCRAPFQVCVKTAILDTIHSCTREYVVSAGCWAGVDPNRHSGLSLLPCPFSPLGEGGRHPRLGAQLVFLLGWTFIIREERGARGPEQEDLMCQESRRTSLGKGQSEGLLGVCQLETGEGLGRGRVHEGRHRRNMVGLGT